MTKPARQSNRSFALMFSGVFGVVTIIGWWFFDRLLIWALIVAVLFLLVAYLKPQLLFPLNRLWSWFAVRIGVVSNYIILGTVWYLVFAPMSLIFRLFRRDSMCRKSDPEVISYFSPVKRQMNKENLSDMF